MEDKPHKITRRLIKIVEYYEVREEGSERVLHSEIERIIPPASPGEQIKIPETPPSEKTFVEGARDFKEYWRALGQRLCAKPTCLERISIDAPATKIYCSDRCAGARRSQGWRQRNPEKKMESDRKYLNDLKKGKLKKRTGKSKGSQ